MSTTLVQRAVDRVHGVVPMGGDSQVDRKALVIPPGYFDLFDPFLMLAEDWFSTPGFDWHPHRGIETVTMVVDGALEHGDNRGNAGVLAPGDVQWMTAGHGIIHRELAHRDEYVHSLQLWVNLPSSHKLVEARYQDFTAADMADGQIPGERNWPIAGRQLLIEPGAALDAAVEPDHRAFLYVLQGRLVVGRTAEPVGSGEVAWSDPVGSAASVLHLEAVENDGPVQAILFSGLPIGEPVVARGPFVMNSENEIRQAFLDFHAGKMGDVPSMTRLP